MRGYYMELPNSYDGTIQAAYDYIKKTCPHLTDGFNLCKEHINCFKQCPEPVFTWWSDNCFLGWGYKEGIKVPFPDVDCILLGEIK